MKADWLTSHRSSEGDLIEMDNPQDVLRVLSVLQFLFCMDREKESTPSGIHDASVFGEGFSWGLCLIVHAMGLTKRFKFMDLSYHVLRLSQLEPLPRQVTDKEYKKMSPTDRIVYDLANGQVRPFLQNVKMIKGWNDNIFRVLETYLPEQAAAELVIRPPPAHGQEQAYRQEKKSERHKAIERPAAQETSQYRPPTAPPPTSAAPPSHAPPSRAPPSRAPPSRAPPSRGGPSPGPPPMTTSNAPPPRPAAPPLVPSSNAKGPPPPPRA